MEMRWFLSTCGRDSPYERYLVNVSPKMIHADALPGAVHDRQAPPANSHKHAGKPNMSKRLIAANGDHVFEPACLQEAGQSKRKTIL